MNTKRLLHAAALSAVALTAYSPLHADDYQYIISGDPVAAATVDSCAFASAATALNTGTLSTLAAAVPLEARYRTWYESDGIALRTDRRVGTVIVIR